eukprot:6433788-Heterocapsa_arctica.AAC.1
MLRDMIAGKHHDSSEFHKPGSSLASLTQADTNCDAIVPFACAWLSCQAGWMANHIIGSPTPQQSL